MANERNEWSGYPHPDSPDNFWIDDETSEVVSAHSGVRLPAGTPVTDYFEPTFDGKSI